MPQIQDKNERRIYDLFILGIVLKGVDGVLEFVVGLLLIFTHVLNNAVLALVQNELIEDPNDFFASHVRALTNASHDAQVFGGLYLVVHGVVKAFLSVALLRNKLWAYPAAILFFSLFILYDLIRIFETRSIPLTFLAVFDAIVLWLIWHEYRRTQKTAAV
jgi:uncharacterized membrane protein